MEKEKAITAKSDKEDCEKPSQMYANAVVPNHSHAKKGFIKCPECGEEILITPVLGKMNEAIEDHILLHKEKLESNLLLKYAKPINIRLALANQVLHQI